MKTLKTVLRIALFSWWFIPLAWLVLPPLFWIMNDEDSMGEMGQFTHWLIFGEDR